MKDNKLILNLCEEETYFDEFKFDLIKKYRKNQLRLQDWCNLNEEEKKEVDRSFALGSTVQASRPSKFNSYRW